MFADFLVKEFRFLLTVSFIILDKNVKRTAQNVLEKADLLFMTKHATETLHRKDAVTCLV